MTGCEPPITVTDDDLTGELFALAIQVNAGSLGLDEAIVEAFWWGEIDANWNTSRLTRTTEHTEPTIWRYP